MFKTRAEADGPPSTPPSGPEPKSPRPSSDSITPVVRTPVGDVLEPDLDPVARPDGAEAASDTPSAASTAEENLVQKHLASKKDSPKGRWQRAKTLYDFKTNDDVRTRVYLLVLVKENNIHKPIAWY